MLNKSTTWIGLGLAALAGVDAFVLHNVTQFPAWVDQAASLIGAAIAAYGPSVKS